MTVVEQFQERVHLATLGLKFLWHRREDDFPLVNRGEVECALARAENLGDFRCQEVLQVVADGFADAAVLFFGLIEKPICEVCILSTDSKSEA